MSPHFILGLVFSILGTVVMLTLVIFAVLFIIGLFRGWKRDSGRRQASAETQRRRHGGRTVLERPWPRVSGDPDPE